MFNLTNKMLFFSKKLNVYRVGRNATLLRRVILVRVDVILVRRLERDSTFQKVFKGSLRVYRLIQLVMIHYLLKVETIAVLDVEHFALDPVSLLRGQKIQIAQPEHAVKVFRLVRRHGSLLVLETSGQRNAAHRCLVVVYSLV